MNEFEELTQPYSMTFTIDPKNINREALYGEADVYDQSIKADSGKPKLSLVPWEIVNDIAKVREYGVKKYGEKESWKKVEAERYIDALLRHTIAFAEDPTGNDDESGFPHLYHVACNVAFLCEFLKDDQL